MIGLLTRLRDVVANRRLRSRFPQSTIYRGATVSSDSALGEHAVLFPASALHASSLGAFSYVQSRSVITNAEVGPFCSIAADVVVGLAAHPTTMVSTSPVFYDPTQPLPRFLTRDRHFADNLPRTTIGADVWIGQAAMVKAGVAIGVGAVIGAGALVTHDVAPYEIVGGVPARRLRLRLPDAVCRRLVESRWWMLPGAELERLSDLFADPERLLAELESRH